MPTTTHRDAFHFDHPAESYWEASANPLNLDLAPLTGDTRCDVAIIGAGYTGLSTALGLREDYGLDVRVLDAAMPGWGASGRNGGFACIGSHKLGYGTMIQRYGLDETVRFFNTMRDAVDLVRDNCRRYGIEASLSEGGEISLAHRPNRVAELTEEKAFMQETFGEPMELVDQAGLRDRGLWGPHFHGGLQSAVGASVHPLNYVRGLARAAQSAGAHIHPFSRVRSWSNHAKKHVLTTEKARLEADHVVIATNGYTTENIFHHHRDRLMPALSNIIVTRPLSEDERAEQGWTSRVMAYDTRNLLHYFRLLPDGRFLFGGRGGTDASDGGAEPMKAHMIATLKRMFPVFGRAEIDYFWRGFVCLSRDLVPYVGALDEQRSVWTSIAYHGNGVAMASHCGRALAHLIAGKPDRANLPEVVTRRLAPFPAASLRPLYLKGAYLWFGAKDEWL